MTEDNQNRLLHAVYNSCAQWCAHRWEQFLKLYVKNWVVGCWRGYLSGAKVQTCIWPGWCHCHSLSLASVKSRLVLPFWYWLIRVVPENGPLNGRVCVFRFLVVCLVNRLDMMCVFVCKLRSLFLCSFFWRLVWFLQYHAKKLVGVNFQSSDMTYFVLSGM